MHVPDIFPFVQMATKEIIAQDIITHEAVYKVARLLDQFCEGMKKLHVLQLIRGFPELFASLFTFTGDICAQEVQDAIFVHDNTVLQPGDDVTLKYLSKFIQECTQTGT
jgi:hypothetical protein